MSKVIGKFILDNMMVFDITESMPEYGTGYGWSQGPGPGMAGCTGFDTIGDAVNHGIAHFTNHHMERKVNGI